MPEAERAMVEWSQVSKLRSIDGQMATYSHDPPQEEEEGGEKEREGGGGERVRETERRDILETAWAWHGVNHYITAMGIVLYYSDKCPHFKLKRLHCYQGELSNGPINNE